MEQSVYTSHVGLCFEKKKDKARKKKEAKEAKAKEAKEKNEEKEKEKDQQVDDQQSALKSSNALSEGGASGEGIIKSAKKSAAKATTDGPPKKSKKRKADGEGEKEPKKKKAKKDEPPKPKVPKPKGPVDVEKQCGVVLPNGGFCARSLTCKSHSMGAKRSVPGRSLPYDLLLAQYQKKNQAKQQSRASPSCLLLRCGFPYIPTSHFIIPTDFIKTHTFPLPFPSKQSDRYFSPLFANFFLPPIEAAMDANAPLPDELDTAGPVDSDEEKDAVMAAIARSRPRPCAQHVFVNTRHKYQYVRMKEMLSTALLGRGAPGGLFATTPTAASGTGPASASTSTSGLASGNVVAVAVAGAVTTANTVARSGAESSAGAVSAVATAAGESGERKQPTVQTSNAGPQKVTSGGAGNQSRKASIPPVPSGTAAPT